MAQCQLTRLFGFTALWVALRTTLRNPGRGPVRVQRASRIGTRKDLFNFPCAALQAKGMHSGFSGFAGHGLFVQAAAFEGNVSI